MNCHFSELPVGCYKSNSQIARVLTESWVEQNMYCPRCGNSKISHFPNNRKVADFYCPVCGNQYELKSKNGKFGNKINDGAYDTFIERITSYNNPDFFLMSYSRNEQCIDDFFVIPKHFFVPAIIEKRDSLSDKAKRAGWTGCNILIRKIPEQGKIYIVRNRNIVEKKDVLSRMKQVSLLETDNLASRGWLMDILCCIDEIPSNRFLLNDLYTFEEQLQTKHPSNHNIRPKIRQQLQVLRDKGFISFLGQGVYQKLL